MEWNNHPKQRVSGSVGRHQKAELGSQKLEQKTPCREWGYHLSIQRSKEAWAKNRRAPKFELWNERKC